MPLYDISEIFIIISPVIYFVSELTIQITEAIEKQASHYSV